MTVFTFKHYSFLSILLAGAAIINSFTIHEQFYPTIIYLTNQKSNKLIMLNFFFMLGLAFFKMIISIFFGEIREIEKLSILDSLKRKIFDIVLIILIYKEDNFDSSFYSWLIVLGFIWVIHQAAIKRSEYLIAQSITDVQMHMKLTVIYIALICLDSCVLRFMIQMYTNTVLDSYFILLFLEYLLISLNIIFPAIKYFTIAFEMFTYSHFQNKNNIFMVLEFVLTVCKLCLQLYMRIKYMLLFPFFVDLIENFIQLYKTVVKFFSSIKLLRLLNQLPDVNLEEIEEIDNTCLICLSEIKQGKKIGCGHFFHKNCLKELIQGKTNQLCPKCRSPINIEQAIEDHHQQLKKQKNKKPEATFKINFIKSHKDQGEPNESKNQEQQAESKRFQFIQNTTIQEKVIYTLDDLTSSIANLLKTQNNEPQVILRVKDLIYNIVNLEEIIKTEEQRQQKVELNLENIFNFSQLLANTNTNLKKCGAISYGLPKIASYNRTFADECLRKKIELMNFLLLKCQRDTLLQTMFFGATKNLTNPKINENENQEEQKVSHQINNDLFKSQSFNNNTNSTLHDSSKKSSKDIIQFSKNTSVLVDETSIFQKSNSKIDPKEEERERKQAWVEKLQSQISQSTEQQQNQQQEQQQEQNKNKNEQDTLASN
ncbi:hypothetical protein ABPG72_014975 [Tetrahymena utriculariae]